MKKLFLGKCKWCGKSFRKRFVHRHTNGLLSYYCSKKCKKQDIDCPF